MINIFKSTSKFGLGKTYSHIKSLPQPSTKYLPELCNVAVGISSLIFILFIPLGQEQIPTALQPSQMILKNLTTDMLYQI